MNISRLLAALSLAVAIALAGWFVGDGFMQGRKGDRFVTVKGVSEREVTADLALWPLRYVATGNELAAVQKTLREQTAQIREFLTNAGIPDDAIEIQGVEVTDVAAQAWREGPVRNRFIVAQTLIVRGTDVKVIETASRSIGELLDAGIVLSTDYGPQSNSPNYIFTRLTQIKPEMIAEATRNARAAAEQFAADSGSHLGGIRRANQGVFQILPRIAVGGMPEEKQVEKTVRVVSTVEYYLED
ncbi:MAG TPA: SIMPL domain-containing protein [Gammaproteobacteria bacterium]